MKARDWLTATVLVTGATGFFGGWLVRSLCARGARVVAVVRAPRRESQFYLTGLNQRVRVETGNVYDREFMEEVLQRTQPDFFFHAAYGADVQRVLREPVECFRSAVESTWIALDAIRRSGRRCVFVVSSSDKAYGSQPLPYDEEHRPLQPLHPYEVAKASMDLAAQSFGKIYGLPVGITRCGNFFGPYDFNYSRLIPGALRSLARGEAPVLRSDGRFTRDFLYVQDAAEAQILLAEQLCANPSLYGEAFNFSYSGSFEVLGIVRRLIELSGVDARPVVHNDVRAEIRHMHLSCRKAEHVLGWRPEIGFEQGLQETAEWYLKHLTDRPLAHMTADRDPAS